MDGATDAVEIRPARGAADLAAFDRLCRAYAASIRYDLEFQGFSGELATLPGRYAPPGGEILIAWRGGEAIGCVALRPLEAGIGEVKRMYVAPEARGIGVGLRLGRAIIGEAQRIGCRLLRLDTDSDMTAAIAVYRKLGFGECERYNDDPSPCTMWFELRLGDRR